MKRVIDNKFIWSDSMGFYIKPWRFCFRLTFWNKTTGIHFDGSDRTFISIYGSGIAWGCKPVRNFLHKLIGNFYYNHTRKYFIRSTRVDGLEELR